MVRNIQIEQVRITLYYLKVDTLLRITIIKHLGQHHPKLNYPSPLPSQFSFPVLILTLHAHTQTYTYIHLEIPQVHLWIVDSGWYIHYGNWRHRLLYRYHDLIILLACPRSHLVAKG